MPTGRVYTEPFYLLMSFSKVLRIVVVNILSNWTSNGDCFGIHKSSVNLKDSSNINALQI